MKKRFLSFALFLLLLVTAACITSKDKDEQQTTEKTIVGVLGQLKVDGRYILDQNNDVAVLRGMSLFWSQWGGVYYNSETVRWLRDDWKCTVIRAAVGVESGGYLDNPALEMAKLYGVIDACIESGIYVIVDWHDHHAEDHQDEAIGFFKSVSTKYGDHPNIIYEIYNEPLQVSWPEVLKPYSEAVISEIRKNDPDNIIVVGTPTWSQDVEAVIEHRLTDENVVYCLHFYASTHRQWLRDKADQAIAEDIPLMLTEWGLSEASGTGDIDFAELQLWTDYMEENKLSWCNWSVINKDETSAALLPTTTSLSGWDVTELTLSGKTIRNYLIKANGPLFDRFDENN